MNVLPEPVTPSRILEAARRHDTQVVFSWTGGAIYGECDGPAPEDAERRPLALRRLEARGRGVPGRLQPALRHPPRVAALRQRLWASAGPARRGGRGRDLRRESSKAGEPPKIFGDGRQTRDYVYAGDVARATLAASGQDGGVFNVGTGEETSVLDLYELCRRVAGSELEAEPAPPRLGELQRSVLDVSLAQRELGWQAEVSLEEGLRRTWESVG